MGHLPLVGLPGDRLYRNVDIQPKPHWGSYENAIMYIDPSGRGRDQTTYCIVKSINGLLVIRKWIGLDGGYDERTLAKLAEAAMAEKVKKIVIESNFGDGMFAELLKPVLWRIYPNGCSVEDDHVSSQKEMRICDNLEPALAMHRLVLDEEVVNGFNADRTNHKDHNAVLKTALYQLTRITRDKGCLKFDDLIDCLAGAVRHFTLRMARDNEASIKHRDDRRLTKMLDDFRRGISISGKTRNGVPINQRRGGNATGVMYE